MEMKIFGLAELLRVALKPLETRAAAVFIYGSIAKHPDLAHDVADIMIIAEGLTLTDVIPDLIKAEAAAGCKINPSLYSVAELRRKLAGGNSYFITLMKQPRIFLIGSEEIISGKRMIPPLPSS